jgi:hypothetical protein
MQLTYLNLRESKRQTLQCLGSLFRRQIHQPGIALLLAASLTLLASI